MNLSEISIRRHVFAWMLMSAFIIFGAILFGRLGISFLPDIEIPSIYVQLDWAGAAPEVMETEIVDRIEQALVSVSGIESLQSTIRQGTAQIILKLVAGRNVDAAMLDVQSNISRIRLPKEVEAPMIFRINPSDQEIMWLGISSEKRSIRDLTVYAERYLRDKFQVLPGVGQLVLAGFAERNLRVSVNHDKLAQYDLTILDVQSALRSQHIEQAAGYLEGHREEINLRFLGEGMSVEQVGDIIIKLRGNEPIHNSSIRLKDVAVIQDDLNDLRSISKIYGVRGGGIGFRKQRGFNSIEVANHIKRTLAEIQPTLPPDIKVEVNYDESVYTREAVNETEFTLILSAVLTALVCWLFFGSPSSTFNIIMSIPTSVLGTFIILYYLGFTLNLFTLLALSLAIGIVVDDAIMVLENIVRHREYGKEKVQAALDGSREILAPAIATTLSVIAVFLPIAFIQGIIGKFLYQFGVTISAAVALSLVEAITLTPMRCSQFLSITPPKGVTRWMDRWLNLMTDRYRTFLSYCLNHRWKVVGILLFFFILTLGIASRIPGEGMPSQDQSTLFIKFETPVGSSLAYTEQRIAEAEKIIKTHPEVVTYFMAAGSFMGESVNAGLMFVSLKPKKERTLSQNQLMDLIRTELTPIEDLKSYLVDLSKGGFEGGMAFPIVVSLQGPSLDGLRTESERLIKAMQDQKLAIDINTDFKAGQPELRITVHREAAAARGVTVQEISDTMTAAFGGIREGKYTNEDRRYDVRIRLSPEERVREEDLWKLTVRNLYGEIIPLREVVHCEKVSSLQTIARRNRERSITISANPWQGLAENEAIDRIQKLAEQTLPEGYRLKPSDAAETNRKMAGDMIFALGLGILVAYMVLASQFNSFSHPFLILLAMPFALSGAFIFLKIFNQTFNLYSFLGLVLLMGIVKKNSILLVEFTHQIQRRENISANEALLKACPIRLRPVLMTSLATIASAIPPALAMGPGAESRIPMALTVLGGSLISMLATLVIVPCSYSLMERKKTKFHA